MTCRWVPEDPSVLCRVDGLCHEACCVPGKFSLTPVCAPSFSMRMLCVPCEPIEIVHTGFKSVVYPRFLSSRIVSHLPKYSLITIHNMEGTSFFTFICRRTLIPCSTSYTHSLVLLHFILPGASPSSLTAISRPICSYLRSPSSFL